MCGSVGGLERTTCISRRSFESLPCSCAPLDRLPICATFSLDEPFVPVVPARGGAEVALGIYKTFLIYRTCMRRAPAKPVRACILRKWCPVSHVTFEAPLRTSHFSLHSSHSTLHTPHFALHTSHCTLPAPHFTLHTPHFTLHTSQSTLHTSHFSLLSSHSTLHTPHFTLHSSRPTLHIALFTLHTSSHLSSSHLIPAHLFSYVI